MDAQYRFLYKEDPDGTARITRVFGQENTVILPERIGGLPVRTVGAYAFAEGNRAENGDREWTGRVHMSFSFGEEEEEGPARMEWESLESRERENSFFQEPICGNSVKYVYLPDSAVKLDRYAFYYCRHLKGLRFSTDLREVDGGAFFGCGEVDALFLHVFPDRPSGFPAILSAFSQKLVLYYDTEGDGRECARFLFPEFFEEAVESSPAHLFEVHVHGCGHRFRNCFSGTKLAVAEYDSLFSYVTEQEDLEVALSFALLRLRFPYELGEKARAAYTAFVREHLKEAAGFYLAQKDRESFLYLARELTESPAQWELFLAAAERTDDAALISALNEIRRKKWAVKKRSFAF